MHWLNNGLIVVHVVNDILEEVHVPITKILAKSLERPALRIIDLCYERLQKCVSENS